MANTRSETQAVAFALVTSAVFFLRPSAEPFGMPKATVIWLTTLALLSMEAMRLFAGDRPRVLQRGFMAATLAFGLALLLVSLSSTSTAISIFGEYRYYGGLLSYFSYATIGLAVAVRFQSTELRLLASSVGIGLACVLIYGTIQFFGLDPFEWSTKGLRGIFSTLGQQNYASAYLGAVVPLAVGLAWSRLGDSRIRGVWGGLAIWGVVLVFVTRSFQGVVGILTGSLLVILLRYHSDARPRLKERVRHLRAVEAGGFLAMVAAGSVLGPAIFDQLSSGLAERLLMWRGAIRMFAERPLLGFGPDTFGLHYLAFRPEEHAQRYGFNNPEVPHSVPISMLTSGGFVLTAAYAAVVVATLVCLIVGLRRLSVGPRRDLLVAFGGMWLAYQAVSLVAIDVPSFAILHWVSAGAIVSLSVPTSDPSRSSRKRRASQPPAVAVAGAVVFLLVVSVFLTRPLRADLAAKRAFDLAQDGRGVEALEEVERATELAPYRATYWLMESQIRQAGGDDVGARRALDEAARTDAGNSRLAIASAQYADAMNDPEAASAWRAEALKRDPHNPAVRDLVE